MANYSEKQVSGTSWLRCVEIVISNRLGETPVVTYRENEAVSVGDSIIERAHGNEMRYHVNLADTIAMRDPDTYELTGELVPVQLIYGALLSDYVTRSMAVNQNNQ